MLFNSYEFIFLYLPIVLIGYFILGRSGNNKYTGIWLIISSIAFYGWWDYHYVPLLLFSILMNYFFGKLIEHKLQQKRLYLTSGIIFNLLFLGYFKYTGFLLQTANDFAEAGFVIPDIILPLGISFFTFTQTAYLVDAYRGETRGYSFWQFCLFVTVFPHLIAGPIIHHANMIPQFIDKERIKVNWENMAFGLSLFTLGLFKKVVIADKLAHWAEESFAQAANLHFIEAWTGSLAYTLQLYFDFSAYSEMAIGIGMMFNIMLPLNFDSPYKATSIIDFWRRWHMTLGSWVKNYLYIPMGGNRNGEFNKLRNLFLSMLIIGIWHGAGWTFILWGAMHGAYLVINHSWRRLGIELNKALSWLLTFCSVWLAWIFFRAESIEDGIHFIYIMADVTNIQLPRDGFFFAHQEVIESLGMSIAEYEHINQLGDCWGIMLGLLLMIRYVPNPYRLLEKYFKPTWWWCMIIMLLLSFSLYRMNTYAEFLYFQF